MRFPIIFSLTIGGFLWLIVAGHFILFPIPYIPKFLVYYFGSIVVVCIFWFFVDVYLDHQTPQRCLLGLIGASFSMLLVFLGTIFYEFSDLFHEYFLHSFLITSLIIFSAFCTLFVLGIQSNIERDPVGVKVKFWRTALVFGATLPVFLYLARCPYLGAFLHFPTFIFYLEACRTHRTRIFRRYRTSRYHFKRFTGDVQQNYRLVETILITEEDRKGRLYRFLNAIDFLSETMNG